MKDKNSNAPFASLKLAEKMTFSVTLNRYMKDNYFNVHNVSLNFLQIATFGNISDQFMKDFLRKATFGDTSNLYMKGKNYNVNIVTTRQLRNALFSYM